MVKEFGAIEGGKQTLERPGEHVDQALRRRSSSPASLTHHATVSGRPGRSASIWRNGLARRDSQCPSPKWIFARAASSTIVCATRKASRCGGKFVYREIMPPQRLTWVFSFLDMDGGSKPNPFGKAQWLLHLMNEAVFSESGGKTTVTLKSYPLDATDEETADVSACARRDDAGLDGNLRSNSTNIW